MDAELRENLAAMSSEFQDSDNEDYSPVTKDIEEGKRDLSDNEHANHANSPPSTIPLITEHIISVSSAHCFRGSVLPNVCFVKLMENLFSHENNR